MNTQTDFFNQSSFYRGFSNVSSSEELFSKKDKIDKLFEKRRRGNSYTEDVKLVNPTNYPRETPETEIFLNDEAIEILGDNGLRRFNEFKTYPNGWYGGKGKKISKGSVFVFNSFARHLPELKVFRPSLFFTLDGNLSLGLEDKIGNGIEIEFFSDRIEYFLDGLNEEDSVKLSEITELTRKIRNLLK